MYANPKVNPDNLTSMEDIGGPSGPVGGQVNNPTLAQANALTDN